MARISWVRSAASSRFAAGSWVALSAAKRQSTADLGSLPSLVSSERATDAEPILALIRQLSESHNAGIRVALERRRTKRPTAHSSAPVWWRSGGLAAARDETARRPHRQQTGSTSVKDVRLIGRAFPRYGI